MKNILSILFILAISFSVNAQKVIFLDAGHGGKDQGGIAATGVSEAEINQLFVKEIKELAEAKGMKVVLLSDAKEYTSLKERANTANNYQLAKGEKAVLLSIHANYDANNPLKKGAEIMVQGSEERKAGSVELAQRMSNELNAPIIEKNLIILREAKMPAVMIETGYISNEQDLQDLTTPDMRTLLVRKIISALE